MHRFKQTVYSFEFETNEYIDVVDIIDKFFEECNFEMPKIKKKFKKNQFLGRYDIARILANQINDYLMDIKRDAKEEKQ